MDDEARVLIRAGDVEIDISGAQTSVHERLTRVKEDDTWSIALSRIRNARERAIEAAVEAAREAVLPERGSAFRALIENCNLIRKPDQVLGAIQYLRDVEGVNDSPPRVIDQIFEDAGLEPPGNLSLYINRLKERKFIQIPSKYGDKNRYAELTEEGRQHLEEKSTSETLANAYKEQLSDLKRRNDQLFIQSQDYLELTTKGAENLERTLESMKEKDLKITRIQDALNRKDSVTFALVTSLKKEIGINDPDIEVNVDKAVVFISLSDKLLFKTGSYEVSDRAKEILGKVATVVNGKPDFECMVEGHTDSRSYERGVLIDNWDLSVKRATSIVRVLEDLDVNSSRLIAAGRSYYDPLVDNDTPENRATNRRTRIIIMPKIDQFYDMIEKEMQNFSD